MQHYNCLFLAHWEFFSKNIVGHLRDDWIASKYSFLDIFKSIISWSNVIFSPFSCNVAYALCFSTLLSIF